MSFDLSRFIRTIAVHFPLALIVIDSVLYGWMAKQKDLGVVYVLLVQSKLLAPSLATSTILSSKGPKLCELIP